jgi:spore coat protein CotH
MKKRRLALVLFLVIAVTVTGCTKGKKEQQSLDSSKTETDSNQTEEISSGSEYASKLFGKDVITIKITADTEDWSGLMENAEAKEYIEADVTIDGVTYKDVGIKTKGNTSLSQVAATDSDRYSLKINFDKYVDNQNCYGLDKLVLNNIFGDSTYLKEYMSYELFQYMEVSSSLHTFADIYVNDEHYGFYLALEDVDNSFLARNYGEDNSGIAYKPESFEMAGNAGMGDFANFNPVNLPTENNDNNTDSKNTDGNGTEGTNQNKTATAPNTVNQADGNNPAGNQGQVNAGGPNMDITSLLALTDKDGKEVSWDKVLTDSFNSGSVSELVRKDGTSVTFDFRELMTMDLSTVTGLKDESGNLLDISSYTLSMNQNMQPSGGGQNGAQGFGGQGEGGKGGQNGGSLGVDLVYNGDDVSNYTNITDNALTKADDSDYTRLIASLKGISEGKDLENYINVDEVLRYAAVNVFLVNLDSYFSNMGHNYVLYEDNGILSMLPWDYNLSFGTFNMSNSSEAVNYAIDTVFNNVTAEERPIIGLLLQNEEYKELYHKYLAEIADYVTSGKFEEKVDQLTASIDSYVKNDTTSFDGYDAFKEGVTALKTFAELRAESVSGQLNGSIPSTEDTQSGSEALVNADSLDLSKLGGMGNGRGENGFQGGMGGNNRPSNGENQTEPSGDSTGTSNES